MGIAWDNIPDLEKAQLKTLCPQVRRMFDCEVSYCGGQVLESYGERKCLLCGAEYDDNGELINTRSGFGINVHKGHAKRKGMKL